MSHEEGARRVESPARSLNWLLQPSAPWGGGSGYRFDQGSVAGHLLQEEAAASGIFDMGSLKLEFFVGLLEQGGSLVIAGGVQHPVEDQVDAEWLESAGQRPGAVFPESTEDGLGVAEGNLLLAVRQSHFGQCCPRLVGQVRLADVLVEGNGPVVKGNRQGRRIAL